MMDEDSSLIQRILDEEPQALEEMIRQYQRQVYYFVRRLVESHEDADDISQQVFIQAYRHIRHFRRQSSLRTWLFQIAQNLCRSHWRKSRHYTPVNLEDVTLVDSQTPEATAQASEHQKLVKQALTRLPDKQRVVLTLRIYEEMSYQEIGQVLGCSENTAKVNYHHAFNKIKAILTPIIHRRDAEKT